MNSSFGTTVARRRRPHFRHSLASGPLTDQLCTSRFGERGISTPTCWGLLKQPDNQKSPNVYQRLRRGVRSSGRATRYSEVELRTTTGRVRRLLGDAAEFGSVNALIQFLLGHVSVQTTERYLGCKQRFRNAVNDRIGLEPGSS